MLVLLKKFEKGRWLSVDFVTCREPLANLYRHTNFDSIGIALKINLKATRRALKHFFPVGFVSGRGPARMETFANIIVKGLNRRNNLFLDVALYSKLGAFVCFFASVALLPRVAPTSLFIPLRKRIPTLERRVSNSTQCEGAKILFNNFSIGCYVFWVYRSVLTCLVDACWWQ